MVEGEATQEPSAPEGAPASPSDESPAEVNESALPPSDDSERSASADAVIAQVAAEVSADEGSSEVVAENKTGGLRLDWSHLRGFQSVEPPGEASVAREDYSNELVKELATRSERFANAVDESIVLSSDGLMRWLGDPLARVVAGEALLAPHAVLLADEALAGEDRGKVEIRVALWLGAHVKKLLGPLVSLAEGADLPEAARGLGAKLSEALGVLERDRVRIEARALDQTARATMRKLGVRFGSQYIYVPILLKPAARGLCTLLWTLRRGAETGADRLLAFASAGRTSFANEGLLSPDAYRVAGFRLCGERVVRVDIIERLSDLIRAALPDHMRNGSRPTSEAYGFLVTPQMTSLTGCSGEAFASILRSLGFEAVKVSKAAFEAANRRAPTEPIKLKGTQEATVESTPGEAVADEAAIASQETETNADDVGEAVEASQSIGAIEPGETDLTASDEAQSQPEALEPAAASAGELGATETTSNDIESASSEGEPDSSETEPEPAAVADLETGASTQDEGASDHAASLEVAAAGDPTTVASEELSTASQESATPIEPAPADGVAEEIEIWRPAQRRPRAPQRPQNADRDPLAHEGKPRDQRHRDQRRRGRQDQAAQAPVAAEGVAPAPVAQTAREQDHRREERGKRDHKGKDEARQREDRRPPRDFGPRREPRPVQVDPDSPFAKLAALKPLLERRDKRP